MRFGHLLIDATMSTRIPSEPSKGARHRADLQRRLKERRAEEVRSRTRRPLPEVRTS